MHCKWEEMGEEEKMKREKEKGRIRNGCWSLWHLQAT